MSGETGIRDQKSEVGGQLAAGTNESLGFAVIRSLRFAVICCKTYELESRIQLIAES